MTELEEISKGCLDLAMTFLTTQKTVAPVALFFDHEKTPIVFPLNLKDRETKHIMQRFVQEFILKEKPKFAVLILDAWIKLTKSIEDADNYKDGDLEKDPDHQEAIVVICRSIEESVIITQFYHKENDDYVFDQLEFNSENNSFHFETAFFGNVWEVLAAEKATKH